MLETDLANLPSVIVDAHKALLDRIKETLTKPVSAERQELSDSLNGCVLFGKNSMSGRGKRAAAAQYCGRQADRGCRRKKVRGAPRTLIHPS